MKVLKTGTFFFLIILSSLLLRTSLNSVENNNPINDFFNWFSTPVQKSIFFTLDSVKTIWFDYIQLIEIKSENNILIAENKRLKLLVPELNKIKAENYSLRTNLNYVKKIEHYKPVLAKIISVSTLPHNMRIKVDIGSNENIEPRMPVITHEGIIGRTFKVNKSNCEIILMYDPDFAAAVFSSKNKVRGIINGTSDKHFLSGKLSYVRRSTKIEKNEILYTSGLDSLFPKGFKVGTVKDVHFKHDNLFKLITVEPFVDINQLDYVFILTDIKYSN